VKFDLLVKFDVNGSLAPVMDRTLDLVEAVGASSSGSSVLSRSRSASPFILKASMVLGKLSSFEEVLSKVYMEYVDYHKYMPVRRTRLNHQDGTTMSKSERDELQQEITVFIAAVASELNDLKYMLGASETLVTVDLTWLQSLSPSSRTHYQEILAFISTRLSVFTKQVQRMHKERKRLSVDPFRIFSSENDVYGDEDASEDNILLPVKSSRGNTFSSLFDRTAGGSGGKSKGVGERNNSKRGLSNNAQLGRVSKDMTASFVAKYEKEAATTTQLKQYDSLAAQHKIALVKEAAGMQVKFSKELQHATRMEGTINQIGELLTEFATILQSQSGQVGDVHDDAKQAQEHVQSSKAQLQLTIERSEKNQKSIIFLSTGLALLLLLLDWIER
jgi:hypothetical protein